MIPQKNNLVKIVARVQNQDNEPLYGVHVVLKSDPTKGTVTNGMGLFDLEVARGEIIVISYMGIVKEFRATEVPNTIYFLPDELPVVVITADKKKKGSGKWWLLGLATVAAIAAAKSGTKPKNTPKQPSKKTSKVTL